MARDKDYRNTEYCPQLNKVEEQKEILEKEIKPELFTTLPRMWLKAT